MIKSFKRIIRRYLNWSKHVNAIRVNYLNEVRYYCYFWGKKFILKRNRTLENDTIISHVMYLKINQQTEPTIYAIRHWVSICRCMKAKIYFICDNISLEKEILKIINFEKVEFEFIPSMRKELENVIEGKLYIGARWKKPAQAHLTAFYHAKENNISNFWTIDADDTTLVLKPARAAIMLEKVSKQAIEQDISLYSLDMWSSRTKGLYWTFGVCYVNGNVDYVDFFRSNPDLKWTELYKDLDDGKNVDWFFTYLRDYKHIKIRSFYFENLYFIHWGHNNPFFNLIGCCIYHWTKNVLEFPVYRYAFKNEELGALSINADLIDFDLTEKEGIDFLNFDVARTYKVRPEVKRLWSIP